MLCPTQTLLVLIITSLALGTHAFPIPNTKTLLPRLEIPNEACKRSLPSHNGAIIPRGRFCGGGGGGGGDFYDGSQSDNNIDIPTIEIHGTLDTTTRPTSSGFDPPLIAVNEDKGLSWPCVMHAALAGWEAGLACSLLEEKYGPGSVAKPPPPAPAAAPAAPVPPKNPVTPPKSPAAPPPAPKPKQPAPAPSPKKSDGGGGWRGIGPVRAVPRGLFSLWKSGNV